MSKNLRPAPSRLADARPDQTNSSLASLARQCGLDLRVSKDSEARYDKHGAFIGWEPNGKTLAIIKGTPEAIEAMRQRMEGAFAPADEPQIELWLAELDQIAPRRAASGADDDLRLRAYVSRLQGYPADVVREALLQHRWRFFPSWAELADVCDELVQHRRAVRAELDRRAAAMRERELRSRALPDQETFTRTGEERSAEREAAKALADEILAGLTGALRTQEADAKARQKAAAESYARFRQPPADGANIEAAE